MVIYLSPNIGEVNPKTIVLHDNVTEFDYYADEYGYAYINFTSDYARHFVYSFFVDDSSKEDANANISVIPGKTTTIDVEVPQDIANNITIRIGGEEYSIKANNGHAIKVLEDLKLTTKKHEIINTTNNKIPKTTHTPELIFRTFFLRNFLLNNAIKILPPSNG